MTENRAQIPLTNVELMPREGWTQLASIIARTRDIKVVGEIDKDVEGFPLRKDVFIGTRDSTFDSNVLNSILTTLINNSGVRKVSGRRALIGLPLRHPTERYLIPPYVHFDELVGQVLDLETGLRTYLKHKTVLSLFPTMYYAEAAYHNSVPSDAHDKLDEIYIPKEYRLRRKNPDVIIFKRNLKR